ncbi:MAG: replication factor C small subunit [Promethearchaeota archaeon CR_4]|nr:MAG: replication factor C small subunit [Candidatus Lokiarchaeota archaeon CR_4]
MSENFRPWVEKYRPRTLDDIVGQSEILKHLKGYVAQKAMPHLLFAGPAGTGKTTAGLCLIRDLFGDKMKRNQSYLELNASDARGIDVIRSSVKDFARAIPEKGIPFRILILDEADNMTPQAQQALRRTMEKYTQNCRFILICNYSNKIIPPIQSRCAVFRFALLTNDKVGDRIGFVAKEEHVKLSKEGLDALVYVANGDCRQGINILQAAGMLGENITADAVYQITGRVQPIEIKNLLELAIAGELTQAQEKLTELIDTYGLSGRSLVSQMHRELYGFSIPEEKKVDIAKILAEIDFRLSQGATEEIQLNALLAKIVLMQAKSS